MLFSFTADALKLQHKHFFTIIKEFNLRNPHLIGSFDNRKELIKFLSKNGHYMKMHSKIEHLSFNENMTSNAIVLLKYYAQSIRNSPQIDFPKNQYNGILIISEDKKIEDLLNIVAAQTNINQKVYILNEDYLEIHEAYKINNVLCKKKLGHIDLISNNFKWQMNVNSDFIKRRTDFHGIVLKGMVGFVGWDMFATDLRYQEKSPYFESNETYQVNGFTDGLYHDILMRLQNRLNFKIQ